MTKIVQIKGSNGSGKTTIVKQLGAKSTRNVYLERSDGVILATVFESIGWAAIGKYASNLRMSGCDTLSSWTYPGIHSIPTIKEAIECVLEMYPGFWVVFEGMMISTIKSTFYEYLLNLQKTRNIDPLFVILKANVDVCLSHIKQRGVMKRNLNVDNVAAKCDLVMNNAATYDQQYVRYIDVANTPAKNMLDTFLWKVQDNELIDALYDGPYLEPVQLVRTV